ncbi:MAG: hypothetical protein R3C45_12080 [Phycisphaerales bacterium]
MCGEAGHGVDFDEPGAVELIDHEIDAAEVSHAECAVGVSDQGADLIECFAGSWNARRGIVVAFVLGVVVVVFAGGDDVDDGQRDGFAVFIGEDADGEFLAGDVAFGEEARVFGA